MFSAHARSERLGIPVGELLGAWEETRFTRRRFLLAGAGLMASGAAVRPTPSFAASARRRAPHSRPRIAIVGAGLAGVRCAHLLWTDPNGAIASTIYEANASRAGGRCWTLRGFFGGQLNTEHGGSFIDTRHPAIRRLAASLGLQEEVVDGGDLPSGEEIYFIDGAYYTRTEAAADWSSVGYKAFRNARRELQNEAGERRLDAMSVPEWLESTEIGATSRLGKLLLALAVTENGGDPDEQSALDLIEITAASPTSRNGEDERYHIMGGNDQIVARMIERLPRGCIRLDHQLVALRVNANRTVTLSFQTAGRAVDVTADHVVLALPFSTLRHVDLSRSELSVKKKTVIKQLGMGSNAKLHVELQRKTWPSLGFSGSAYSEWEGFCSVFDDSVPQGANASPALLLGFPGGRVGRRELAGAAHGSAPDADVKWFLRAIERVYPGTSAQYTGRAYEDHWAADPWVRGAYSYFRVGQASTFGPIAAARQGRIHFAGEHTSGSYQGFLEGAVETGERAARELRRLTV
jgi:monoamine oxidase